MRNSSSSENLNNKQVLHHFSFLFYALPGAISILQVQALDVFMYTQSPIGDNLLLFLGWIFLQGLMGVIYAKISDGNKRKLVFVLVQMLGVPLCMTLYFFGHGNFIPIMLVAAFNPLSVAKAALLDNFPKQPPLRIIVLTYFLQYLPWAFYDIIGSINPQTFLIIQVPILIINSFYTLLFVKDKYSVGNKVSHFKISKKRPRSTLSAFFFAEAAFYLIWAVMESKSGISREFSITTVGTIIGILLILWYSNKPHFSLISLFYAGCTIFILFSFIPNISMVSLPFTSLFGGMYLPLVTDSMILFYGGKHKAYAASLVEFTDSLSRILGTIIPLILVTLGITLNEHRTIALTALFLVIATIIQKSFVRNND